MSSAPRHRRRRLPLVVVVMIVAGPVDVRCAELGRAEYYAGLRSRRLFSIAETDCQRRLADPQITRADRAELTIELSKTFAAHAAFAVGQEQEELWSEAAGVVDELLQADPTSRFRSLVAAQRAMVPATRGAQLRWRSDLFPLDELTRTRAAETLRDAVARLKPLPDQLDETLRSATSSGRRSEESQVPAPYHVHQLRRRIQLASAVAALDLAKVLPSGPDRTASLISADRQFDELATIARPDPAAWQSRVGRLDVQRFREPADRLAGQVRAFLSTGPPSEIRDAAAAVLVRSYLAENRPDDALESLEEHRQQYGLDSKELQALVVECLLAARRLALEEGDVALAAELLEQSEKIDAQLSGPWKSLTRLRLEDAREEDRYGPKLARLVNEAKWAWKNGDAQAAIAAYSRAAGEAHQQQRADLAVELALTTASIQVEAGQFDEASRSLSQLVEAYPSAKQTADADLLRAYALGRIYQQRADDENKNAYREALTNHRTTYSRSPTANEASWMLARLAEHDQNWEEALTLYSSIPADSGRKLQALSRTATIYERVIEQLRSQDRPVDQWEQQAAATLAQVVAGFPPRPARLSFQQAEMAATFARILLHHTPARFSAADALLVRVIDSGRVIERDAGTLDAAWQTLVASASQWRIISLTGQGQTAEAQAMLETVGNRHPERLLDILEGLSDVAATVGIEHRQDLGRLQLDLVKRLQQRPEALSDVQQRKLDSARAQAQVALGNWQTAAKIYEELLWKQPKDPVLLEALAALYEECGSNGCLREAIKRRQELESLQRKGSIEWLTSRYQMAWCSHQLGDDEAARKLIVVTRVLYPQLGSPALKARFERLLQQVVAGTQK